MNVLVACEYSGIVRSAFAAKGHNAWSCDLLPTDIPGQHIVGDINYWILGAPMISALRKDMQADIDKPWDLMIAHPPCTHLAVSGARWFKGKEKEQEEALRFVSRLLNAPIPKICLENPVSIISSKIRKPNQIIQPWQFGHPEAKKTCLWLKNLPILKPTNVLEKPECGYWDNQTPSGQNKLGPSENRWKERSKTYEGIALAMVETWG